MATRNIRNFHLALEAVSDRTGVYLIISGETIRYVGGAPESFRKSINEGPGLILPTDCLRNGDAERCRVNAAIHREQEKVRFFVHITRDECAIREICRVITEQYRPEWNNPPTTTTGEPYRYTYFTMLHQYVIIPPKNPLYRRERIGNTPQGGRGLVFSTCTGPAPAGRW
jgi:hypothetical protein